MKRRNILLALSGAVVLGLSGCAWWNGLTMRSQSPEEPAVEESSNPLIGDYASATGMQLTCVESIGLVVGLHGTGSDPTPSPQRAALLEEMQTRDVGNPNRILRSGNVAMVMVMGILRPGIQKGDHFDIEVRVPEQSETTSLRGGFLLESRLTETACLGGQLRKGDLLGLAQGPIMVDPMADPKKDRIALCRGRILGGGVVLKPRPLALVISPEHKGVRNSSRIANAVDKRFNVFENGVKEGMAKAINDQLIELKVHPRYKDNIARYVQVVRSLAIAETAPEQMKRITKLQRELLDPATSAGAALQLEAIGGSNAADVLLKGIQSKDIEVRFYAAEALAYLDRREAAEPLGQIAREEPAFRVFALTALSVMKDFAAADQLRALLSAPSAETRYGAFRSLWTMDSSDPMVKGEMLGGFHYHGLDVPGEPMIHVTRNRIAEIVVFVPGQKLLTPLALSAGNEIMITTQGGDEIVVSKYSATEGDQKRTIPARVDDMIRSVVELGGTYPDVVQALQEAKRSGALASRFEVDALPTAGRMYDRAESGDADGKSAEKGGETASAKATPTSPAPDLFYQKTGDADSIRGGSGTKSEDDSSDDSDSDEKPEPKKGFFARMLGR